MLGREQRVRLVDVLSGAGIRTAVIAAGVAALLCGCGGGHPVTQSALPPARPVPVPTTAAVPTTTSAAEDEGDTTSAQDAGGGPLPASSAVSFGRLQAQLGGRIGVAVSGIGFGQPVQMLGPLRSAIAWSTSKVPVAMAIYSADLAAARQQDLDAAITESDNAAAERLWAALGGGTRAAQAADAQLRAAGDVRTSVQSETLRPGFTPFGQTVWSLADQTRFVAGMPCLEAGGQVLGLMDRVVAGERWGLGSAGVPAQFKGGWGPGSQPGTGGGYLDRQTGIATIRGTPVAISIATLPSDGSHATGTGELTTIARWVVANVRVAGLPRQAACG